MRVPATTDMIQETRGKLESPEIRVWCHPHRIGEDGDDTYVVFEGFKEAEEFIQSHPEAEDTPLIAFRGYELNLWNMEPVLEGEDEESAQQTESDITESHSFDFFLNACADYLEQAKSAPDDYTRDAKMEDAYKYLKIVSEISYSSQEQKARYKDIKGDFWESAKVYGLIFDRDCLI